jgi:L,D-transpeptidase YcbB
MLRSPPTCHDVARSAEHTKRRATASPCRYLLLGFAVVVALGGDISPAFSGTSLVTNHPAEQISPSPSAADVPAAIRAYLGSFGSSVEPKTARREYAELTRLYAFAAYAPLWVDAMNRPTRQAQDALAVLGEADAEGLDSSAYACSELARRSSSLRSGPSPALPDIAAFDITLTRAMLRYFRHVHLGRVDPRTLGYPLTVPDDTHDFVRLLHAAIVRDRIRQAAAELMPPLAQYRGLRTILARYRLLAAHDDSDQIPGVAVLRPGERHGDLAALRRRLVTYGDLDAEAANLSNPEVFEGVLVEAVKRFQARHGLEPDGIVGVQTEAALRVPLRARIRQIELALERLRWLPDIGDRRLIALNIPMFHLWTWDTVSPNGVPSFGMRVVVGRALRTQTPVFVQDMRYVVFRPYWNVPVSIARHEILPALERHPDYLQRHQIEIVRGTDDAAIALPDTPENRALLRQGRLRLRQRPGPHNALGLVKFVFPNNADVYMHGTPAQVLFSRTRRDFSHGCVRIEDPVALATWVLQSEPDWTRERVQQAMAGSTSQRVDLSRPIQVILFYSTAAFMPETGAVHFAEDIYRHDLRLDRALAAH